MELDHPIAQMRRSLREGMLEKKGYGHCNVPWHSSEMLPFPSAVRNPLLLR